jgi:high-affinity nickel-transport protein
MRTCVRQALADLSGRERRSLVAMGAAIVALHAIGFGLLFTVGGAVGVGVGLTAYTLGLRHAFDADHIGAIDNATRKLMADGQRPLSVGFFFSLGHSTIVFGLAVLIVFGFGGLVGSVQDDGSALHQATGLIGPLVSGTFLLLIGVLNLVVLASIVPFLRAARHGEHDPAALTEQLERRGLLSRLYRRATSTVSRPWHMYPLGCLFGLGFDTATEVALLVVAGGAAASGLPYYVILCMPILFAAGMSLLDTVDGAFMKAAYGWAFAAPVRRAYYNVTITGLSVVIALGLGTVQLAGALVDELGLRGGVWSVVAGVDLELVGYALVVLFALTWAAAAAIWRYGRMEERWGSSPGT